MGFDSQESDNKVGSMDLESLGVWGLDSVGFDIQDSDNKVAV